MKKIAKKLHNCETFCNFAADFEKIIIPNVKNG